LYDACPWRRQISIIGFKFHCTAARCGTNHHENFIRGIGYDWVNCNILFRSLDDSNLC